MWTWILAACALLPPVAADPDPANVRGASPLLVLARFDKEKDRLVILRTEVVMVPRVTTVKVVVDGRTVERPVTSTVAVPRQVEQTYELKVVKATDADGKEVDAATLKKQLLTPTVVVVSTDGQPVTAGYRKALRKETVVLQVPLWGPAATPLPVAPPPPPPPPVKKP
jgi:hypothetical protein